MFCITHGVHGQALPFVGVMYKLFIIVVVMTNTRVNGRQTLVIRCQIVSGTKDRHATNANDK